MNFNVTAELASPLEAGDGDLTQSFALLNCVDSSLSILKSKKRKGCISSKIQRQKSRTRFQLIVPVPNHDVTKKSDGSKDARRGSPNIVD